MVRLSQCFLRYSRYNYGTWRLLSQPPGRRMGNSLPTKVSGRWKHLIVCPDRGLFHGLTTILAEVTPGASFVDLKSYPARRALTDAVNSEQPNLCFLDVGSVWDSAITFLNELNSIDSSI